jgi:hypothetical protein
MEERVDKIGEEPASDDRPEDKVEHGQARAAQAA